MAPRKRASSGGKKSSNPNREPQQSQPSKFGIQHFFGRHSQTQTQKALAQNGNGDPTANSSASRNSHVLAEQIVNRAEVAAENSGAVASSGSIGSRTECSRGVNPRSNLVNTIVNVVDDGVSRNAKSGGDVPAADHSGVCSESSNKRVNDGVVDVNNGEQEGHLLKSEPAARSQSTPTDNLLPVVIDDDDDNQMEVTPETSKSVSVKRFKFSPGMVSVVIPQFMGLNFCGLVICRWIDRLFYAGYV